MARGAQVNGHDNGSEGHGASSPSLEGLRRFNLITGIVHLLQALAIFVLSNDFSIPITAAFVDGPPGSGYTEREVIWKVPIGLGVGVFLLLAAIDHLLMAAPRVWPWYRDNLRRGINYARWWEYSASASVMVVLIALIVGVSDIGAIIAIAGVNAAMIFFGMVMEQMNPDRERVNWTPFWFGCVAGAIPWVIIVYQFLGADSRSPTGAPGFVYGIVISLFVLFNSFAVNMALQYRRAGRWRDYLYGERVYIILSLVAKTALAWQVFANTLV